MLKKNSKTLIPVLGLMVFMLCAPLPEQAYAQSTPADTHEITETLSSVSASRMDRTRLLFENLSTNVSKGFHRVVQSLVHFGAQRQGAVKSSMPYYSEFQAVLEESVLSRFGTGNVKTKLDEVMTQMISAHDEVENATTEGTQNPFAGTTSAGDARVYEILTTTFCNPDSVNSPQACKNSSATPYSNENFIDMFVGERTWSDKTIIDSLLVARRFFAATEVRDVRGMYNEVNFISNRAEMAKANLRMSILNHLASRRAPTSTATSNVLEFMFDILASATPFVMTTEATEACDPRNMTISQNDSDAEKSSKFINGYVCSFTSAPVSGTGERFISEAAIDRIIQHDFYLSPNFYGVVYAPSVQPESLERMEVFMKAQQVAQDYRQLRLLQMKVAAVAMNLMNE